YAFRAARRTPALSCGLALHAVLPTLTSFVLRKHQWVLGIRAAVAMGPGVRRSCLGCMEGSFSSSCSLALRSPLPWALDSLRRGLSQGGDDGGGGGPGGSDLDKRADLGEPPVPVARPADRVEDSRRVHSGLDAGCVDSSVLLCRRRSSPSHFPARVPRVPPSI